MGWGSWCRVSACWPRCGGACVLRPKRHPCARWLWQGAMATITSRLREAPDGGVVGGCRAVEGASWHVSVVVMLSVDCLCSEDGSGASGACPIRGGFVVVTRSVPWLEWRWSGVWARPSGAQRPWMDAGAGGSVRVLFRLNQRDVVGMYSGGHVMFQE